MNSKEICMCNIMYYMDISLYLVIYVVHERTLDENESRKK